MQEKILAFCRIVTKRRRGESGFVKNMDLIGPDFEICSINDARKRKNNIISAAKGNCPGLLIKGTALISSGYIHNYNYRYYLSSGVVFRCWPRR